jgi:hypothetical protein
MPAHFDRLVRGRFLAWAKIVVSVHYVHWIKARKEIGATTFTCHLLRDDIPVTGRFDWRLFRRRPIPMCVCRTPETISRPGLDRLCLLGSIQRLAKIEIIAGFREWTYPGSASVLGGSAGSAEHPFLGFIDVRRGHLSRRAPCRSLPIADLGGRPKPGGVPPLELPELFFNRAEQFIGVEFVLLSLGRRSNGPCRHGRRDFSRLCPNRRRWFASGKRTLQLLKELCLQSVSEIARLRWNRTNRLWLRSPRCSKRAVLAYDARELNQRIFVRLDIAARGHLS